MKRCPECGSTYTDRIDFCFHEGAELIGSTVDATDTLADDAEAGFDLPGLQLPPAPHEARPGRSEPTPVPLARMQLPPDMVSAPRSPLAAPPPPPRHADPVEATDPAFEPSAVAEPAASATPDAPQRAQTAGDSAGESPATPVSSARSGPPPAPLDPSQAAPPPLVQAKVLHEARPQAADDTDHASAGVPAWAWLAGGVVGVVLVGGAVLFALGGLGMLGAASARVAGKLDSRDGPPLTAGQADEPADDDARFPEGDDERFPDEPLQVGVVALDSDTIRAGSDAADTDTDATQVASTGGEAGDEATAATEDGSSAGGTAEPASPPPSAPGPVPVVRSPGTAQPPASPDVAPVPPEEPEAEEPEAPSPWGAMPPDEPATQEPPVDLPDADAITVTVTMEGGGDGLELYVDGALQPGKFPHQIRLGAGTHFFKVVDDSGKQYEIGKPIRRGSTGSMSLQLFPP